MNKRTLKVLEYDKIIELVADKAVSDIGKKEVFNLKPCSNKDTIKLLLDETSEAVSLLLRNGNIPLEGFFDISDILKKAKINSILSMSDLLKIASTLRVVRQVRKYLGSDLIEKNYAIIGQLISSLENADHLEKEISKSILSEIEMADEASTKLFQIRRNIKRKNNQIREKLTNIINSTSFQKYLQENIITIRQDRFVIPVKKEYRSHVPGLIHDQSVSGATLFIEPIVIVDMNNDLRQLKNEENIEIERILIDFSSKVKENHDSFQNNLNILKSLDLIFAKAKYSIDIKGNIPKINEIGYLSFIQARHPLIHIEDVVASDIYFGDKNNTLIITGPNTGGKTVTLKTIGLLCLMVQTGIFIPVKDGSEVTIFSNVFADIGDEQSIEQNLSTFSSHMTNIVNILDTVNKNSLVLFDELGAGTDPTEGAALAMSILDYLHKLNIHTVATTHYSELKQYAITTPGVVNACVEFNVETLRPTFKLLIGIPGKSNAFEISKRLGLSNEIILHSKEYIKDDNIRFEDILHDIENKRKEIEKNYLDSKKIRLETEKMQNELQIKEDKFNDKKDLIIKKAKEEALLIIKDAQNESKEMIDYLRKLQNQSNQNNINKEIESVRRKLKDQERTLEDHLYQAVIPKKTYSSPKNLKVGDEVLITNLNQKGFIINLPNQNNEILVQVGIMKMNVHVSNIYSISSEKKEKKTKNSFSKFNKKSLTIKPTLDIRGMTTEDAIIDVEKYIDDAYLSNLKQITIIHGKGTGVLRDTIHQILKCNNHVDKYRLGNYNEGGIGVSIVTLK